MVACRVARVTSLPLERSLRAQISAVVHRIGHVGVLGDLDGGHACSSLNFPDDTCFKAKLTDSGE